MICAHVGWSRRLPHTAANASHHPSPLLFRDRAPCVVVDWEQHDPRFRPPSWWAQMAGRNYPVNRDVRHTRARGCLPPITEKWSNGAGWIGNGKQQLLLWRALAVTRYVHTIHRLVKWVWAGDSGKWIALGVLGRGALRLAGGLCRSTLGVTWSP